MVCVADWLKGLGLERYEQLFAESFIDADVLRDLTDLDLEKIGVPLGHRKKLLRAIAELPGPPAASTPLSISSPPTGQGTAERRQLTVMFCDLVGSTALSTRLDPEDLRAVISAYHRCCTEVVERNGGFVAKYMGDGVLAYFGYPRADELDAERSIRAALALIGTVPQLATAAGAPLQVRVGIATGLVVVGDLVGTGAAQEQAVVGETPNLAARLQALAEPGAVVVSAITRQLAGGLFEYRDLGPVALKGFADSTPAWQVLAASTTESRFEALRASTTPLVGRDEEIDLLMRRWAQAKRGDGQVALICGEPGIGKSRITQTIVERISSNPHTRLRYFCSPHHQDDALYPSTSQLERAAGFRREDTPEERLRKLEAVLAQATNDLTEAVPLLANLLSIPTGDRYPPINLTPQKRKEKTLAALIEQVQGLAARQPVLMVFEDIHWSDPTTRESLDLLVDRVATLQVLAIFTFRPEFTPPWVGRPHVTMVTLNRLPLRHRAEMIGHVTAGKALPKEIADQIVDRTDGVPLFIEELTKAVVESGIVTDAGDRYAMAGPAAPLAIPTSLHASLLARLDRLAPTREIAQIGAALGRSFSHDLISAVASCPRRQLDDSLDQLVRAELIFRRGTPPDAEYTFKHALVQDAAYSTLLRSQRVQLHSSIAMTLESQFPEIVAAEPALLAHHCFESGNLHKASEYLLKCGKQLMLRSAMTEAYAQLNKGLDYLGRLPDNVARQELELGFQTGLGNVVIATQGFVPAAGKALSRSRELCEQLNRPIELAAALGGLVGLHANRGELRLACRESLEMLTLAQSKNDPHIEFVANVASCTAWFHSGDFDATRKYAERALLLYDQENSVVGNGFDSKSMADMFLFRSLFFLGYLDQARARTQDALEWARKRDHNHTLALLLVNALSHEWLMKSDASAGVRGREELAVLAADHGYPYLLAGASWVRACFLTSLGRSSEAVPLLAQAVAAWRSVSVSLIPAILTCFAEALGNAGRPTEGLCQIEEAERQVEATEERWTEAEIHRVRGDLLVLVNDIPSAVRSYKRAIAVGNRQNAKLWELRAAMSLARVLGDQSKCAEAHDVLAPIYGWFTEGLDTPVLKDANALLGQLSA
jgi:class 3 adenylate cyclase/tetratricopeptide (TPR) repeat protein